MKNITSFIVVFIFLAKFQFSFAASNEMEKDPDGVEGIFIDGPIKYFFQEDFKEIPLAKITEKLSGFTSEIPENLYTKAPLWVNLKLTNHSKEQKTFIFVIRYLHHERVDFYANNGKSLDWLAAGGRQPNLEERKDYASRYPKVEVKLDSGESKDLVINIVHVGYFQFTPEIKSTISTYHSEILNRVIVAGFTGAFLFLGAYNMLIFLSLRIFYYALYSMFIFSSGMSNIVNHGFLYLYFLPNAGAFHSKSYSLTVLLMGIFGLPASFGFLGLNVKSKVGGLVIFLQVIMMLLLIALAFMPLSAGEYLKMFYFARDIVSTGSLLLMTGLTFHAYLWLKRRETRLLFISWIPLAASAVTLFSINSLNLDVSPVIAEYSLMFSVSLEMLLLSVALADKLEIRNRETIARVEEVVAVRTKELRVKNRDIESILSNLSQGIFTSDKTLQFHPEYSKYLEEITETKDLKGQSIMDRIFSKCNIATNDLGQLASVYDLTVNEDPFQFEINSHLLPKEATLQSESGKKKILEFSWDPVVGESGVVEKIMTIVKDVTALRALQAEAAQKNLEITYVNEILVKGPEKCRIFLENQLEAISALDASALGSTGISVNKSLIILHTLKGNFRTYGLGTIASAVHELESEVIKKKDQVEGILGLDELAKVRSIKDQMNHMYKVLESIFISSGNSTESGVTSLVTWFQKKFTFVKEFVILKKCTDEKLYFPLETLISDFIEGLPAIARKVGKPAPNISIVDSHLLLNKQAQIFLAKVVPHFFANALDHGIEDASERKQKGKAPEGQISLVLDHGLHSPFFTFLIKDDGRGFNLRKLREKGLKLGLLAEESTAEEVAQLIFSDGMSTAAQVTEISGRGVGMSAVRAFVLEERGKLKMNLGSETPEGMTPFEILIELPRKFILDLDENQGFPGSVGRSSVA